MVAPQDFIYTRNELISHIPFPNFVRLLNFQYASNNALESRLGFEPIQYFVTPIVEPNTEFCHIEYNENCGLALMPELKYTPQKTYFLNHIEVATLSLFGDSLIFSGPNASSFHIIPFALKPDGTSNSYSYTSRDVLDVFVEGDERGGTHVYQGKPLFWNGKGSYQVFANTIAESGFTRLGNNILALEDQTIIAACTFESRLVVATLQGNLIWSQPNWDGISPWDDVGAVGENFLRLTLEPGEVIEFIREFRGGLVISTRNSAKTQGRIYNLTTLDPTALQVIPTGRNSFFSRNGVVELDDVLMGIAPQGLLRITFDSFNKSAAPKTEDMAINVLLEDIYANNTIFSYLDAYQESKIKKAYFIYEWDLNKKRTTKMLCYHFGLNKWSQFETSIPIQRMFTYYGYAAGAGWVHDEEGNIFLGMWVFSELRQDIDIKVKGNKVVDNKTYYFWEKEIDTPHKKKFVTGSINIAEFGSFVPGSANRPVQLFFSADEEINFKLGYRSYTKYGNWSPGLTDFDKSPVIQTTEVEKWSDRINSMGIWGTTHKLHYLHRKPTSLFPNADLVYQVIFETSSDAFISLHDMSPDSPGNS